MKKSTLSECEKSVFDGIIGILEAKRLAKDGTRFITPKTLVKDIFVTFEDYSGFCIALELKHRLDGIPRKDRLFLYEERVIDIINYLCEELDVCKTRLGNR